MDNLNEVTKVVLVSAFTSLAVSIPLAIVFYMFVLN